MVSYRIMNLASLLLCLVFAVVGYFVHPMMLPQLIEAGLVSETALDGKKLNKEDLNSVNTDKSNTNDKVEKSTSYPDGSPRIIDEPVEPDSNGEDLDDPLIDPSPAPVEIPAQNIVEPKLPEPIIIPAPETSDSVKPAPSAPSLSNNELIEMMKQSVRNKEVKEFSYNSVLSWLSSGVKEINGQTYQVGEVIYKDSTFFGNQALKAKALFQDKKLVKWVWPTTNADMK